MSSDLIAAENLAQAIRQVAGRARSEEDLRVGVEHALGATLQTLGLTATPEYEKTTLSGSADAVYGHAVIEYKRPGRLAEKNFPAKLAGQIARYLTDLAHRAGGRAKQVEALEKMIGIGLDGEPILFLRYSASGRVRESPIPALTGTQATFLDFQSLTDFGSLAELPGGFHADQFVGEKPVLHKNTVVFVACDSEQEAHYLCAMLNSSITNFTAKSYSVGKSFGSPHLLKQVSIPHFNPDIHIHTRLAALLQQTHQLAAAGDEPGLAAVEAQVDEAATELWSITDRELKEIRRSLAELG